MCAQQRQIKEYSQERLDLGDYQSLQDFVKEDFAFLNQNLIAGETYIVTGLTVSHIAAPSLNIRIAVPNAVVMNNSDDGVMYVAPNTASNIDITVLDGTTTYIWLTLDETTGTNAIRTFWDKTANGGVGAEFSQAVDTESTWTFTEHTSTTGFPAGDDTVIHICVVTAAAGTVTSIIDHRKMLLRLGRGGDTLDAGYSYPWSSGQDEANPDLKIDANAFIGGDKQIQTFKDWFDVVMTKIRDIQGTTYWTDDPPSTLATASIDMTDGGTWSWVLGTNTLSWSGTISFLIPGTAFVNTVAPGNIVVNANNKVVYVDVDITSNATLTPVAVASSSFVTVTNRLIIARRISDVAYIGLE